MEGKFTAVFEKRKKFWIAYVKELPGANTQGRTLKEARANLMEAIQLVVETNQELARKEFNGKDIIREEIAVNF
jgi:predicted RNase H-like HicB family nuclease